MKDILIIAHFTQVPGSKGNGRFHYIAEKIDKERASVEVVTTSFSHKNKIQRNVIDSQLNSVNYKFTMVNEPGYKDNVSFERLYSHYIFGKNLKKYLITRKNPDIIYCAVPSLDAAAVAAKYAKENDIRFIIDIQDLWPEAFEMVFNIPLISDILFYPIKKRADFIYKSADEIIAVSKTYAKRALKANKKCQEAYDVFLGTELGYFDKLVKKNRFYQKPEDEVWLAYIGTLGYSYDLICVMDALKILKDKGIKDIKFIIMGNGPLKDKFKNYAREKNIYTEFTGRLAYGKMAGILSACDIAVNPITNGAASIINKHGDYAAAGLPVLNTQECGEYRKLIDEYKMGLNCENNNTKDLANKLLRLYKNADLRCGMGKNSRRAAEEKFDRKKTYNKIIEIILR